MADAADLAEEATVDTPGDRKRDEAEEKKDQRAPRPKGARSKASIAQSKSHEIRKIRTALEGILGAPSMVMSEPWPKAHIESSAPNLANALCVKAEGDDQFRAKLLAFLSAGDGAGLLLAAAVYVVPVAIYYGAPAPPAAKAMLKVPERPMKLRKEAEPDLPEETIVREAAEHGYDDVEAYKQAVRDAVERAHGGVLPDD
jgi:hypothetical protein